MFKLKTKRREPKKKRRVPPMGEKAKAFGVKAAAVLLASGACIFLVLALAGFLANMSYFKVRSVEVLGADAISSLKAEELLDIYRGRNIFSVDILSISNGVYSRYPDAKEVVVRKVLPDRLSVWVSLRLPIALVRGGKYYPVDKDGVILPNASASAWQKLPIITGVDLKANDSSGKGLRASESLRRAIVLILAMQKGKITSDYTVTTVDVSDPKNISFFLEDGLEIKIGHEDFKGRLEVLRETLKNPKLVLNRIKYIDLRFKDVVIGQK